MHCLLLDVHSLTQCLAHRGSGCRCYLNHPLNLYSRKSLRVCLSQHSISITIYLRWLTYWKKRLCGSQFGVCFGLLVTRQGGSVWWNKVMWLMARNKSRDRWRAGANVMKIHCMKSKELAHYKNIYKTQQRRKEQGFHHLQPPSRPPP